MMEESEIINYLKEKSLIQMVFHRGDYFYCDRWNQVFKIIITGRPDYPFTIQLVSR